MLLIGRYRSPFTRRVAVSAHLLGVTFDSRPVSVWESPEEVLRHNPLGRVPVLILDGGEVLVDSATMLDYLDDVAGPERALVPPHGAARRRVMNLVGIACGAVQKAVDAIYERTQKGPGRTCDDWVARCEAQSARGFQALERSVEGPWMTGARLTQADISTVVFYQFVEVMAPGLFARIRAPALDRLAAAARDLPAFQAAPIG